MQWQGIGLHAIDKQADHDLSIAKINPIPLSSLRKLDAHGALSPGVDFYRERDVIKGDNATALRFLCAVP
jgi:hypothetical protein